MGLFYKPSDKELLKIRNDLFVAHGIPALENNGFVKSPFSGSWFGRNNLRDYTYELCRIADDSTLEIIETHISKGDKWVKITLNIFMPHPKVSSIDELRGVDGLQYHLPPNSITRMRLRIDDYKGMPLFRTKEHRLKSFYSEAGLKKSAEALSILLADDLDAIGSFVKRWHELHRPLVTDWGGVPRT